MSVTRTALCNWRDTQNRRCPQRNDPFEHVCYHCHSSAVEHCHVGDRGMGGRKGPIDIVLLCHYAHERITLNEWRDGIRVREDGRRVYWISEADGTPVAECLLP